MNKDINDMNVSEFATYYKELCNEAGIDTTDESLVSTVVIKFLEELEVYKKAYDLACEDIAKSHPILSALGYDYYKDRYLQKARKE